MSATDPEREFRTLLEERMAASSTKDIDRMMALYAPQIVYFDVVPPLHFTGSEAVRANFQRWFDEYDGDIALETHDLGLHVDGDVAIAHMLHRDIGAVGRDDGGGADGQRELWLRSSVVARRVDGAWRVVHEHISMPVDLATLQAVPGRAG